MTAGRRSGRSGARCWWCSTRTRRCSTSTARARRRCSTRRCSWCRPDEPSAAVISRDMPDVAGFAPLVKANFLVRTRADADAVEARANDLTRATATFASGATDRRDRLPGARSDRRARSWSTCPGPQSPGATRSPRQRGAGATCAREPGRPAPPVSAVRPEQGAPPRRAASVAASSVTVTPRP